MTERRWHSSVDECQRRKFPAKKPRGYVKIGVRSQQGLAKIFFGILDYDGSRFAGMAAAKKAICGGSTGMGKVFNVQDRQAVFDHITTSSVPAMLLAMTLQTIITSVTSGENWNGKIHFRSGF